VTRRADGDRAPSGRRFLQLRAQALDEGCLIMRRRDPMADHRRGIELARIVEHEPLLCRERPRQGQRGGRGSTGREDLAS
jgi:hypothetical protein